MKDNGKIEAVDLMRELVSEGVQIVNGRPPRPGRFVSRKKAQSIARIFGVSPENLGLD